MPAAPVTWSAGARTPRWASAVQARRRVTAAVVSIRLAMVERDTGGRVGFWSLSAAVDHPKHRKPDAAVSAAVGKGQVDPGVTGGVFTPRGSTARVRREVPLSMRADVRGSEESQMFHVQLLGRAATGERWGAVERRTRGRGQKGGIRKLRIEDREGRFT